MKKITFFSLVTFLLVLCSSTAVTGQDVPLHSPSATLTDFDAGAAVIDMGITPQTDNNGLKPYGLVMALVEAGVPVNWIILDTKDFGGGGSDVLTKTDDIDLTISGTPTSVSAVYSSHDLKAGPFLIAAEFMTEAEPIIQDWIDDNTGLTVYWNLIAITDAPVHGTISLFPQVLVYDANSGTPGDIDGTDIFTGFYDRAGINDDNFSDESLEGLYRSGPPVDLTDCDSFYVLSHHTDPDQNWSQADIDALYDFVVNQGGNIWMGCHDVSLTENTLRETGGTQLNFLSNAGLLPYNDLKDTDVDFLWLDDFDDDDGADDDDIDKHDNAFDDDDIKYSDGELAGPIGTTAGDPIMQFMGDIEPALNGNSEHVYIPFMAPGGGAPFDNNPAGDWRATTVVSMYDTNIGTTEDPRSGGLNAIVAYGPAYGVEENGDVLYTASHISSKNGGSDAQWVGEARLFANFLFESALAAAPDLTALEPAVQPNTPFVSQTICSGDDLNPIVTIANQPVGTETYLWEWERTSGTGGDLIFTPDDAKVTVIDFPVVNDETVYKITFTVTIDVGIDCVGSIPVTGKHVVNITVNPEPTLTITDPAAVCSPSTVDLTDSAVTSGSDPGTLTYWTDSGATSSLGSPEAVTTSGTYYIKLEDANGCSVVEAVLVTVNQAPIVSAGPNKVLTCANPSVILNGSASGGANFTYSWTGPNSYSSNIASPSVNSSGVYTLTVTNGDGCEDSDTVSVTQNKTQPTAHITASATELTCETTAITLTAAVDSVQGTASYFWSDSLGSTSSIEVNSPGSYSVTVTDSANGCSVIVNINVTQDIAKPVALITGNEELTCINEGVILDASSSTVQGTVSYLWSPGGETTDTIDVITPGVYSVTVTDSANGCSETMVVEVLQDITEPVADIVGNEELTCANESIVLDASGSTGQGELSYLWSTGAETATIEVGTPGEYSVTVTDSDNSCSDTFIIEVTQDITEPEAAISGNEELTCANESIVLDASGSTGQGELSYLWSTGEETAIIDISEAGEYSVTVTDSDNGCSNTTSVEVAQDITEPSADISGVTVLTCNDGTSVLDASGSTGQGELSYLWSTGEETATIEVSEAGEYSVTITDSDNGCSDTTSVEVSEDISVPEAMISGETELTCDTQSTNLDASGSVVDGEPTYLWSNGEETATINVSEPGVYSVTVTDSDNGCSDVAEITITQNAYDVVPIVSGNTELTCQVTSTQLDASGSTVQGTVSYTWSTGENTSIIEVTEAGNYTVTVTDTDSGCANATVVEVTFDDTPQEIVGGSIDICIEEETLDLTSLLPGGYVSNGTWSDDMNSGGVNGDMLDLLTINLGNYEFTYTEPEDCGRLITVSVDVNDDCVAYACESPDNITISKVVTVNNDGVNDTFEVSDVQSCEFFVDVKIFNRWGKIVYESSNYQNNWRGHHDNSGQTIGSNSKLPTGTYFYVVNIVGSGYAPRTGYIYLGTN